MRGKLTIFSIHKDTGEQKILVEKDNLILNTIYAKLVKLFGGDAASAIDRMQYGTGTDAPQVTDVFLQTPITPIKSVASVIDPSDDFTVVFTAYLLATEANGFPISEAGLLTHDGDLVTRITFTATTKTSDYNFGFRWTITVKT